MSSMKEEEKKEKETEVGLSRDSSKDSKTFEDEKKRRSSRNVSEPPKYAESMENSDGEIELAVKKSRSDSEKINEEMSLLNKRKHLMITREQESTKRLFDINDDDFLSNLPDDCIKKIFKKFGFGELEKMCEVSRKMQHFAILAKSRKENPGRIVIRQHKNGDFVLAVYEDELDYGDCLFMTVKTTPNGMETVRKRCKISGPDKPNELEKFYGWGKYEKMTSIPSEIFNGFEHLIKRFNIRNIKFSRILIDDNFVSNVERILKGIDGLNLTIWKTYFQIEKDGNMTRKFMNWIGSANAKSINLHEILYMSTLSGGIYEKLINDVAKSPGAELDIFNGNYNSIRFPNDVPVDSIPKYAYFNLQDLKFDVESVRQIVKTILIDKRVGTWHLKTWSRFERDELLTTIGTDVEVIDESPNQYDGINIKLRLNGFVICVKIMNFDQYAAKVTIHPSHDN